MKVTPSTYQAVIKSNYLINSLINSSSVTLVVREKAQFILKFPQLYQYNILKTFIRKKKDDTRFRFKFYLL